MAASAVAMTARIGGNDARRSTIRWRRTSESAPDKAFGAVRAAVTARQRDNT
jgi:hypothetical protein